MNKPFTLINIAMMADGKMDTFERKGSAISSKRDMEHVDQLRAECVARWLAPNPVKIGTPPSQILKKNQCSSLQGLQGS